MVQDKYCGQLYDLKVVMQAFLSSPILLLLATGAFLGLTLPLGKIASDAMIPASLWALLISAGAGFILLFWLLLNGKRLKFNISYLRYYFLTAFISYAVPNLLILMVIPKLGTGFTGIMYTLSPVITLLFSIGLKLRRPDSLAVGGIFIGCSGALMVALSRSGLEGSAEWGWILVALMIPVTLSIGNIYRSIDWPKGAHPVELACGSHLASVILLTAFILLTEGKVSLSLYGVIPMVSLVQACASAAMFALFFRLQAVGGPVYLSQIGYVAAAIGLVSGSFLFGEHYQLFTWLGALIITIGVSMTTRAQMRS